MKTDRVQVSDESRGDPGGGDPDDFGRKLRRFATDVHRVLKCPDSPVDEMFGHYARAWSLLQETPGDRSSEIRRWLLAVRRAIGVRLQSWASEELKSLVG